MNKFFLWLMGINRSERIELKPEEEKKFNQLKILWEESARMKIPEAPDTKQAWSALQRAIELAESRKNVVSFGFSRSTFFQPHFAFATAIVLILIVSSLFLLPHSSSRHYSTDYKEQLAFDLPDDSNVRLNSVSKLMLMQNFNRNSREVTLQGEGYFEVRKGNLPFIVVTDVGKIKVLGTQFNVKSRDDHLEVAVNQGTVELASQVEEQDSVIVLTRGEFSTCHKGGFPDKPQTIQFQLYPGWIYGKMSFHQTEFKYVCQEIERRFDVPILIEDKHVENLKISGLFEAAELDNLLSTICILMQKEYRYENDKIIIY